MCDCVQWQKDKLLIYDFSSIACLEGPLDGEYTITVSVFAPATFVSIKWFRDVGGSWVDIGESTLSIVVNVDADYRALLISSEGSILLDITIPCADPEGPWITPEGDPWETPGGDSWIWLF